jgi:hypothetical protein
MGFKADNPLLTHDGIVHHTGRKVESIARLQINGITFLRQPKCDRTADNVDYFVITVVVGAVYIAGSVGSGVRI